MLSNRDVAILLMKADKKAIRKIMNLIEKEKVTILKPPSTALIMATAIDPFDTNFCLGEVLVTEAQVEWSGNRGFGMIIGDEPEKALALAFINSVESSDDEKTKKSIKNIITSIERVISKREKLEEAIILSTKVNFETMVKR